MFEYKLQKAWERYVEDFGLGRISLFMCFFCIFLLIFTFVFHSEFRAGFVIPIILVYVTTFFNEKFIKLNDLWKFIGNLVFLAFMIPFLYQQTGVLDEAGHGLTRYDEIFASIDQLVFKDSVANIIQDFVGTGSLATLFYDWIQTSYLFYFIFPFYGAIVYYRLLKKSQKYKVSRLICSVGIFFSINYFLYILVPVTGPQFFMPSVFTTDLPFSLYGKFLNSLIANGQPNFIDCFPSGHVGISLLMTIWFHRMKSKHFYFSLVMLISIFTATLALRYHYTLDVLCSVPLVLFCYKISRIIIPVTVSRRRD
jgi:hypothetical protein